jgi:hypothetical protein
MKLNPIILNSPRPLARTLATTVLMALAASQAHGFLTVSTQIDTAGAVPSVLQPIAGDLLETSVTSFSGENAGALVRNGSATGASGTSVAGTFPAEVWGGFAAIATNPITTYDFDLSVNTFGYDITAVQVYSAWNDARSGQNYQLFYALVGDPTTFSPLDVSVVATATNASVITRTEDSVLGASLLSGVSSIRFVHATNSDAPAIPGTGTVYREFDVVGFASVPEPATSMFGLCASLLLFRRRRA